MGTTPLISKWCTVVRTLCIIYVCELMWWCHYDVISLWLEYKKFTQRSSSVEFFKKTVALKVSGPQWVCVHNACTCTCSCTCGSRRYNNYCYDIIVHTCMVWLYKSYRKLTLRPTTIFIAPCFQVLKACPPCPLYLQQQYPFRMWTFLYIPKPLILPNALLGRSYRNCFYRSECIFYYSHSLRRLSIS